MWTAATRLPFPQLIADRLDERGLLHGDRPRPGQRFHAHLAERRVNTSSISASTVYSDVVDIRTLMSKANVPKRQALPAVTPDIYAAMLKSPLLCRLPRSATR
ncbi:MAG: hypothetical protein ACLSG5_17355 [Oscillospiraceae bacterium]